MSRPKLVATVGMPRSGTTLLASMLAAQPAVRFVTDYLRAPMLAAERFARRLDEPLPAAERRAALLLVREEMVRIGHVTLLGADDFETLAQLHRRLLEELREGEERVVGHKMVVPAGQLEDLLRQTDLTLVMLYRDPRDAALSFWYRVGGGVEGYLRDWRAWMRVARRLRSHPRFVLLRYETLATDPTAALAPLEQRLGLTFDWRGVQLHFDRGPRSRVPLRPNTAHDDVGQRPDAAPVGRWQRRLDDPIVRYADWYCRRDIRRLGYPPHPAPRHGGRQVAAFLLRAGVDALEQHAAEGLRAWQQRLRPRLIPPLRPRDGRRELPERS